ncbi:hypothetical protein X797_005043 [Metarhizium robertsii]|uniref:Uncharacterized protein n=1 Tax=Metarhizium robertsii TaxID=568076 RepID=A0A0A1UUU5_9HYPO|nr:hypothetical protein X797_005043 [Metarhizium robertsii]
MVGNWFWAEEMPPKMRRLHPFPMHRVGPDLQVGESPELWITIPSRPRLRVEIESVPPDLFVDGPVKFQRLFHQACMCGADPAGGYGRKTSRAHCMDNQANPNRTPEPLRYGDIGKTHE